MLVVVQSSKKAGTSSLRTLTYSESRSANGTCIDYIYDTTSYFEFGLVYRNNSLLTQANIFFVLMSRLQKAINFTYVSLLLVLELKPLYILYSAKKTPMLIPSSLSQPPPKGGPVLKMGLKRAKKTK